MRPFLRVVPWTILLLPAAAVVLVGCSGETTGQDTEEVLTVEATETTVGGDDDVTWTFVPPPTDVVGENDNGPSPEDAEPVPEDVPPADAQPTPPDTGPEPEDTQPPVEDVQEDSTEDATAPTGDGDNGEQDADPLVDVSPPDPCEAVVCAQPPEGYCEGDVAVNFSEGTCVITDNGAECEYPPNTTDCMDSAGQFCSEGACEPCTSDQQCNDALTPSVECASETVALLVSWQCEQGACTSVSVSTECAGPGTVSCVEDVVQWTTPGCIDGAGCIEVVQDKVDCAADGLICLELDEPGCMVPEDMCLIDEECLDPPEALCDGDTSHTYPDQGICQGPGGTPGVCVYLQTVTPCDVPYELCDEGLCWPVPPPCDPDLCVQWPLDNGGNGHWYELVIFDDSIDWTDAMEFAEVMGGHLATTTSAKESSFIYDKLASNPDAWDNNRGPWLGGYQDKTVPGFDEPWGGWSWVTGEPWVDLGAWAPNEPNEWNNSDEDYLHYYQHQWNQGPANAWNDAANGASVHGLVVEYPWP